MFNLESAIGASLLGVFVMIVLRKRSPDDKVQDDANAARHKETVQCTSPSFCQWCEAFESMFECPVLCFDESMRFVSCGKGAVDLIGAERLRKLGGELMPHLMDVIPPSAAADLVKAVSAARRGDCVSRDILWNCTPKLVTCTPIAARWVAVSIRDGGAVTCV